MQHEQKAAVKAIRDYLSGIGHPVSQVQGCEVLARALGLKSKHVLAKQTSSGQTGAAAQDAWGMSALEGLEKHLPVTLFLNVYSTSEEGDAPEWARVEITAKLLSEIARLSALCTREKLEHACVDDGPDRCGVGSDGDDLRVSWSLVVDDKRFWYQGYPKYDDEVRTCAVPIVELLDLIRQGAGSTKLGDGAWVDGKVYWDLSCNPQGLAQEVPGFGSDDEDDEDAERPHDEFDLDSVAEWVGLHYKRNFAEEPEDVRQDWIRRYQEAHSQEASAQEVFWTHEDNAYVMEHEGWALFTATDGPSLQLQRIDDPEDGSEPRFASDEEAWKFVGASKDPRHLRAMAYLKAQCPQEYAAVMRVVAWKDPS